VMACRVVAVMACRVVAVMACRVVAVMARRGRRSEGPSRSARS
jgi:hypothetical protein